MPNTDPDDLQPALIARLRAELNRVWPPNTAPRYLTSSAPVRAWRLAPLALAIAFTGIVALTAYATTGSPNPAVWTNRVQTVINSVTTSPTPEESPPQNQPQTGTVAPPTHKPTAAPSEQPEPSGTEHESPEPGDHSTTASVSRTASPSPDQ